MIAVAAVVPLREFALDVALDFAAGVTLITGASGSGKTTLLRLVAGLVRARDGCVTIDGETVDDGRMRVPPERRRIGYVPQEYALFPHLDVVANVGYGLAAQRVPRDERDARARAALERLGIASLAAARPPRLSGGQRQRVALARALVTRPRALLLDEPFAALDTATRADVRAAVRDAVADLDVPTLLVTHDLADAAAFDAPVVRIDRGRAAPA